MYYFEILVSLDDELMNISSGEYVQICLIFFDGTCFIGRTHH